MSNVDVTRDAPHKPLPPVDESVKIPDSVKRAAEKAESFYKQQVTPTPEPAPEPAPPAAEAQPAEPAPPSAEVPVQPEPEAAPSKQELQEHEWARRYNSMKGRHDKDQQVINALQEQRDQLADELTRAVNMLNSRQPQQQEQPQQPVRRITEQDEADYGPDLIDLARRAAEDAINPKLNQLEQENENLKRTLQASAKKALFQTLDVQIPNWRDINRDPRFKRWLSLPDVYTNSVRGSLLNAAMQAADAPRVVAFFKGFISDGVATGHVDPVPQTEQPILPVPRQAAVSLETLAAPGRARPSTGEQPTGMADKPIYSRAQIQAFYRDSRAGVYAGREAEKTRIEQELFVAQREGRIR